MAVQSVFQILRNSFLHRPLRVLAHWYIILRWRLRGSPVPPPALFKQKLVQRYGRDYSLRTLVETGTAKGKMVRACLDQFERIISIELDAKLYLQAKAQFAKQPHITLLQGDSGEVLVDVLAELNEPSLFWLDAHYMVGGIRPSQVTPIIEELTHILAHRIASHVILIDDARLFTEKSDYPTIQQVESLIKAHYSNHTFRLEDDVIRICPV